MSGEQERQRPADEDDLQAFIDGRLPPERQTIVADYLARHPDRAREVHDMAAQRETLRAALRFKLAEPIPRRLSLAHLAQARRLAHRRSWAMAAAVMLAVGLGAGGGWVGRGILEADRVGGELEAAWRGRITIAASAHKVFVADAFRPVEIFASAGDVVVRWLTNRLGRPVAVPDLSGEGLRFIGGRLIPTLDGAAAQLMFEAQGGARVTLFMVPTSGPAVPPVGADARFAGIGDLGTLSWADPRFLYTVVGVADEARLSTIASAIRAMLPPAIPS